jgi:hypothetical protein
MPYHDDYEDAREYRPFDEYDRPRRRHRRQPHSGLGVASLVIAVFAGFAALCLVAVAGYLETVTEGGMDEESVEAILIGLGLFAVVGGAMLGLGLGLAGLFQQETNSTFPILGLVFNGMILLGLVGLVVIGLAVG